MAIARVALAWLLLAGACVLPKHPPPAPPRHTDLGLSISSVTLANGLRVVLVKDRHAREVQVTMRYRVGAGDDLEHPGMAHLVEHLMFQQQLGSQSLFAHLEESATFFNAATTYDATTYVARAGADQLDKLLSIEAVRLGFRCTSITDSSFEREREVVKQEVRLRDDATEVLAAVHGAVYPEGHPYRQAIGGSTDSVASITRTDACAFADSFYAPSNAVLVISGNLTNEQVETSLGKFIARVAKRVAANPASVPALAQRPPPTAPAPIDSEALLVAWPLPTEAGEQLGARAIGSAVAGVIDAQISGKATYIELGDVRAPALAIVIQPAKSEHIEDLVKIVRKTVDELPGVFELPLVRDDVFHTLQQRAIYGEYASMEDGSSRDARLASFVLADRDPAAAVADEFNMLRTFGRHQAADLTRRYLSSDAAMFVTLTPTAGKKRGRTIDLAHATHDMGQRRTIPDPARALQPAERVVATATPGIRTRVLPNGLRIVLLPVSSVPTVDARLVFGAGTGDEPMDRRGAATVAARGLTWDLRYVNDLVSFQEAGGSHDVDVDRDRTSFAVRGVDMHLDYLLAALRRWVRDGRYDTIEDGLAAAVHAERKRMTANTALLDAWYAALYGPTHPYVRAGLSRYISPDLTTADAERFRAAYFTPDNATLVIAGRFDADLADRWIDFLFADWQGKAKPRPSPATAMQPVSLAKGEDLAQTQLTIAIPAPATPRAQQLVAAEMLSEIARDVRHQLGAAYSFDAALDETRLAKNFIVGGWIDSTRSADVLQFLRDRLAKLQTDPDAAARAFVAARDRALTHLTALTSSASALAGRVETDVELGREPLSDLQTAAAVRTLTIAEMTETLAALDLSHAAVLMRGPDDTVKSGFATLGRTPTFVKLDQVAVDDDEPPAAPGNVRPHTEPRQQHLRLDDLEMPITEQGPPTPLTFGGSVSYAMGTFSQLLQPNINEVLDGTADGVRIDAEVGYRFTKNIATGLHLGVGTLTGDYPVKVGGGITIDHKSFGMFPIDIGGFAQARPTARTWAALQLGLHVDGTRFDGDLRWAACLGVGLGIGYELFDLGSHHFGPYVQATGSFFSQVGFGSLSIGAAYHH